MRAQILINPYVKSFLNEHQDEITNDLLEKNLMKLYEFGNQSIQCDSCQSLENCKNLMQGYYPKLVFSGGSIEVHYDKCPRKVMDEEKRKNEKLIKSLYVPKDILHASFEVMDRSERAEVIKKSLAFVMTCKEGQAAKGLYFHGEFGVGKSYILGAIANELAKHKISSMIVYVPGIIP